MTNNKTISISIGLVLLNIVIGHFFSPTVVLFSPLVVTLVSLFIGVVNVKLSPILKTLIIVLLISIQDVGLKLFAGGDHGQAGQALLNIMFLIGIVPAFIFLLRGVFRDKLSTKFNKWISVFLFLVLISIHFLLYENLGSGEYY